MDSHETARTFQQLGLNAKLLKIITKIGYTAPTPIQADFIPIALKGADCIGQARTGTGKTAAFALPVLQMLDPHDENIQALILCPTRELSEQVNNEFQQFGQASNVDTVLVVGGRPLGPQIKALQKCPQVVIGTPGRVIDLIQRGVLQLGKVRFVVLDEADRMLDIGFRKEIERILRSCPEERQTLLLSATLDGPVEQLARRFMRNPQRVDLSEDRVVVDTIRQFFCTVEEDKKFSLLVRLLLKERPSQVIVFCRTKRRAQEIHDRLKPRLDDVTVIHGDLQQRQRDKVIQRLREGRARLVIATDIVGRGIDISGISHIVNFDIPQGSDDYIHRVGRTGRMSSNSEGRAFTFVTPAQGEELTRIEMRINTLLEEYSLDEFTAFQSRKVQFANEDAFFEKKTSEDSSWDEIFTELA